MKNILYILALTLFTSYLFSSCIDDDSKSFQFSIPNISIAGDDNIQFPVGKISEYQPNIQWVSSDSNNYTFLWTLNGREELSTEKTLRYTFTETGVVYLTFQMTDKTTKVTYGQDFKATISSEFFLGWLILSDKEGRSALDFIHMDTYELYPDIYHSMYPNDPLGSDPFRLETHHISKTDQILIMQRGGDGCVELDGSTFKKVIRTEEEFYGEKYPEEENGFQPIRVACTHKGPELLLTSNGNIYDRITEKAATVSTATFQSAFYSTVPFQHVAGQTKFTYFTFPASLNFQLMFDDLNKRWLAYYNTTTIPRAIPVFTKGYTDTAYPDVFDFCNGMDDDVQLVYAETYNESSNNGWLFNIFLKAGIYYLNTAKLTLATSTYKITVTTPTQREFAATYEIDEKTKFHLMQGTTTAFTADPHLFFNIGKKVYFYHYGDDKSYFYKDFAAESDAPTGDLVTIVQKGDATQLGFAFSDGHFYICDTDKTTLTAIRQNNLDPTQANAITTKHFSGLGNIVHAAFKYGKATNYTTGKNAY